jgi:hypothetical protein
MRDTFQQAMTMFRPLWPIFMLFGMFFCQVNACANIVILGDLTHDYRLRPGQTHEAVIELENRDPAIRKVRVYQSDYTYLANGENQFPTAGTNNRSNARWLTFSPRIVTIPPMQKSRIHYLIRAPKDSAKNGTYWSMLMVQDIPNAEQEKSNGQGSAEPAQSPGCRYGVQIITQIDDTGKIGLEFTSATVVSKNAKRLLVVDIENKGTKIAKPELWLEVYSSSGQKTGRFVTVPGNILPGCGIRREIDLSSLPKGSYNSLLIADCGKKDVFGLELKLVLSPDST